MPELPDVVVYIEALEKRIVGERLEGVRLKSPFLLRTAQPPIEAAHGKKVRRIRRLGKRIAIGLDGGIWLVLHLMIAGRLHWADEKMGGSPLRAEWVVRSKKLGRTALGTVPNFSPAHPRPPRAAIPGGRRGLAAFDFSSGTLLLTEAGSKKRASLQVVEGEEALRALDLGGLEVLDVAYPAFRAVLQSANHTLKRALTDPRKFSGIGNAYSDEILHRAGLSPVALTQKLDAESVERLWEATRETLGSWVATLREEAGDEFPEKVTAFRSGMAVHGRYGKACPTCGEKVRRIRYAANETNYCPGCQTGGKLLADRSLSRLLKKDWPRTPEEMEERLTDGDGMV